MHPRLLLIYLILTLGHLSAATVRAVPDTTTASTGDTITVQLEAEDIPASTAWGQLLRFDPDVLRFTAMTRGEVGTFVADSREVSDINASGEIRTGGFSMTPISVEGALVSFTFTVISAANTTTKLDVVEKSASEPFGCVFHHSDGDVIPLAEDALVAIEGSSSASRSVTLRVTKDGNVVDKIITVDPADGTVSLEDGVTIFNELFWYQSYMFSVFHPQNG